MQRILNEDLPVQTRPGNIEIQQNVEKYFEIMEADIVDF